MDGEANGKDDDHDDMDEVGHGKALGCWFVRGLFSFCFSFYTLKQKKKKKTKKKKKKNKQTKKTKQKKKDGI